MQYRRNWWANSRV